MVTYKKLYNILREKILKQELLPGERLPTEKALCDEYGLSRITVRHALMLLQEQNFIERLQGRGTYVKASKPKKAAIMDFAYSQSVHQELAGLERQLLSEETVIPPVEIVTNLKLLQNEECLFLERLDVLGGIPLAFDQVYIPPVYTRSLTREALTRIDFLTVWLQGEGIKGSYVQETIEAVGADTITAHRLDIAIGSPVLMSTEIIYDRANRPLAIFISKYKSTEFKMTSSYSLPESADIP